MKYRAVYQPKLSEPEALEVVSVYENDSNVITTTGQKFLVDDLDDLLDKLASLGVDVSFFWKNAITSRINPVRPEIDISNHPLDNNITRKAFVWRTNSDYTNKRTVFCVIIRHFISGVHDTATYDDAFVTALLDNNETVDDGQGNQVPEYDFLFSIVDSKAFSLFELENARISIMDGNDLFGSQIY